MSRPQGDRSLRRLGPLLLTGVLFFGARAHAAEVRVFAEGVRFDLATGRQLDPEVPATPFSASPLSFRAARDEVVSFQVRLSGGPESWAVETASAADVAGRPVDLRPEVFLERGVEVRGTSDSPRLFPLGLGLYPDALVPTTTVAVPAAPGVAVLFVDLFVPRDLAPGRYAGAIGLRARSGVPADAPQFHRVAYEVEVLEVTLPMRDVARLGAVNFGSFLAREEADPEAFLRWMQLAHAHALTVELMRTTPRLGPDGVIRWDEWLDHYGPYLDGSAFTAERGYRGPRAGRPVTRFIAPLCEFWPVPPDATRWFPSEPERWAAALAELEARLVARGHFAREDATEWIVFINSLDEPKKPAQLEALRAYAPLFSKVVDRRRFTFRVDGVLGVRIEGWPEERKVTELGEVVDLWNLHGAPNTARIRSLEPRRALGERFIFYASNSGGEPAIPPLVLDSAIAGARAWAWIVARYRLDGALNWEVDYKEGCVVDPHCSEAGGLNLDALLIYRGHEVGARAGAPVASMRLKALRRGAQDVALLARLAERDPERAELLAATVVPRALGDGAEEGRGRWMRDGADYARVREEILDALTGVAPKTELSPWAMVFGGLVVVSAIAAVVFARRRRVQT